MCRYLIFYSWNATDSESMFVDPTGQVYLVSSVLDSEYNKGQAPMLHPVPVSSWDTQQIVPLETGNSRFSF